MKYLFIFIITFNCLADDWSTENTQREEIYMTLHVIDWAQTRNIARNPDRLYEVNPLIGEHPSIDKVDLYFSIMALAHYYVSSSLQVEYRSTFQKASIYFEGAVVSRNLYLGIGVKF